MISLGFYLQKKKSDMLIVMKQIETLACLSCTAASRSIYKYFMNVRLRKQEEEKTISPVAESPGTVRTNSFPVDS